MILREEFIGLESQSIISRYHKNIIIAENASPVPP